MPTVSDDPERARPDFEAQHRADPDFPIFDSRTFRGVDVPDYSTLSDRDLAAMAAAYTIEAIACQIMARRRALARRSRLRPKLWRGLWESNALTASLAAYCCNLRLRRR